MHITPQDGSSSIKKKEKDLAFKASQEKGKARLEYESSSDDEVDDASLVLSLEKQMILYHPNLRSSNLLRKSLEINMINLRGYIMSSSLAITS